MKEEKGGKKYYVEFYKYELMSYIEPVKEEDLELYKNLEIEEKLIEVDEKTYKAIKNLSLFLNLIDKYSTEENIEKIKELLFSIGADNWNLG